MVTDEQRLNREPVAKRPWPASLATWVLGIEGLFAAAFAGLGLVMIASGSAFGLWPIFVGAPPASVCGLAIHGLWKRARWGYFLCLIALLGLAISAAGPFISEPETFLEYFFDPPSDPLKLLIVLGWPLVVAANIVSAVGILRPPVRAWFGIAPLRLGSTSVPPSEREDP